MKYLPPFEVLKSSFTVSTIKGEPRVGCSYKNLVQLIRQMIAGVKVDGVWFLQRYPDNREAIERGEVQSPRLHFFNDGYFEGRLPFTIDAHKRYYLGQNAGVGDYVRKGMLESG